MSRTTKQPSFRFRSRNKARAVPGYVLLLLMMTVTILLIGFTAALPSIYQEGQREREEELVFRGNEYARAIDLFHRRFNRFPSSVDELLHTNGFRFLRREYRDPMSKDGKWRFIHISANGAILDSKTLGMPKSSPVAQNPSGSPGSFGSLQAQPSNSPGSFGFSASPPSSFGQGGFSSGGQTQPTGTGGFGTGTGTSSSDTSPFNQGGAQLGAFIVGVASRSHKQSIRIVNHKDHYDDWEFIGIAGVGISGEGLGAAPAGMAPQQPQRPFPPGGSGFGSGSGVGGSTWSPGQTPANPPNIPTLPPEQNEPPPDSQPPQ